MRNPTTRTFLCIYFPERTDRGVETKNVCVAFNGTTERALYRAVERLGSTEIKKRIAIFSYDHLVKVAEREDRGITEVIKMRLGDSVLRRGGRVRRTVTVKRDDVARWRRALMREAGIGRRVFQEILAFLDDLDGGEKRASGVAA
ncbi:MAG: hypothetical protein A3G34_01845 [Candidatus Lindowbacteria bacterium RIFCSPLOWO2_12_FULL_62_27]|nr:MAG: hypothetical protein A3G34_01845 [Candidatus Lindowbacteria bacterium RIFCSPLOWO2_12_FULL_62_27]